MELRTNDYKAEFPDKDIICEDADQSAVIIDKSVEAFTKSEPKLSKDEFYKHQNMKTIRNGIQNVGIVCYISAVLTIVMMVCQTILDKSLNVTAMVVGALITAIIMISLGLGIHLMHSKVCMYILLVFCIINFVMSMILEGAPGGILILLIAILGTYNLSTFEKAWKEYQETGHIMDSNKNNPFMKDIGGFRR